VSRSHYACVSAKAQQLTPKPPSCRHGGDRVSRYLRDSLASLIEASHVEEIPAIIDEYRSLGGYLKRYRGGPLDRFRKESPEYSDWKGMALDDLAVLAFLKVSSSPNWSGTERACGLLL
jgi:protein phosphatase PTC6